MFMKQLSVNLLRSSFLVCISLMNQNMLYLYFVAVMYDVNQTKKLHRTFSDFQPLKKY